MRHPKIFSLIAGLFLSSGFAYADTLQDVDLYEAGGNYYCYPWLNQIPPSETPAPEGYEPFHLEHYSRHGSRWHIGNGNYDIPYEILTKAKAQGKLTPLGEKVLSATIEVRDEFKKVVTENFLIKVHGNIRGLANVWPKDIRRFSIPRQTLMQDLQ